MIGAIEVHMKAGDALLFVDAIMHGSAERTIQASGGLLSFVMVGVGTFVTVIRRRPELVASDTAAATVCAASSVLPREPQKKI